MKLTKNRQLLLTSAITASGIILFAVFIIAGIKLFPGAVSYTASTKSTAQTQSREETPYDVMGKYNSIYGITEDGPFRIISVENNIYVCSDTDMLYCVKASLSQFPEKDRIAISSGITAHDKTALYEIVEYMES